MSDKDYEVRTFIGRDFARLEPIAVRFNQSLLEFRKNNKDKINKKTGEIIIPKGKELEDVVSFKDLTLTYFSYNDILNIVKSGIRKPGIDHRKEYERSLIDVENWDYDEITKAYEEVLKEEKNRNFFFDSPRVKSLHLNLESPQNP